MTNNETRVCRKITVKGLYGNQRIVSTFQTAFKKKISDAVPEHEQEAFAAMATQPDLTQDIEMTVRQQQQDLFTTRNFQGTFRQLDDGEMIVADDEEGETLQESNSVYHIHKILSSDNYSIGQTVG